MPSPKTSSPENHTFKSYLKKKNRSKTEKSSGKKLIPFKFPNLSILVVHYENCACVFQQYEQLQNVKYSFSCGMLISNYACVIGFYKLFRKRLKFY